MICTLIAPNTLGQQSVCVILGPQDLFSTKEGDPMPGIAMNVVSAREIAYRMLYLCQLIENGKTEPILTAP